MGPLLPKHHKLIMDEWYDEYFDLMFRYAMTKLNNDEDAAVQCTHAVFDSALENIETLKNHDNISGWMIQTLKNQIKRYYRKDAMRQKRNQLFLALHHQDDSQYENWADNMISQEEILRIKSQIILQLSKDDQNLYQLYYVEHRTVKDISKAIGISESAAKVRLFRLRSRVCDYIK